jgi:hypothetical protein
MNGMNILTDENMRIKRHIGNVHFVGLFRSDFYSFFSQESFAFPNIFQSIQVQLNRFSKMLPDFLKTFSKSLGFAHRQYKLPVSVGQEFF